MGGRLQFGFNTEGKITSIAHEHGWGLAEMATPETQPTSAFGGKADIANSPRYVRNFNLLRPVMAYPA